MSFLRRRRTLFVTRDKLLAGNVGKTIARVSPRSVRYIVEYTRLLFQTLIRPLSPPLSFSVVWVCTQIASRDGRRYRLLRRAGGTAQRWTLWKWSTLFFRTRHPAAAVAAIANRKQYGHRRYVPDIVAVQHTRVTSRFTVNRPRRTRAIMLSVMGVPIAGSRFYCDSIMPREISSV